MMPISATIRYPFLLATVLLLSACVGRQQALNVAQEIKTSSDDARLAVQAVVDVQKAQTKALQNSIDTLETVATGTRSAIVDRAKAELDTVYAEAKLNIWRSYYEQVDYSYRESWDLIGSMPSQLTVGLQPLNEKINQDEQDALKAEEEARISQTIDKKLEAAAKAAGVFAATSEYNRIEAQSLLNASGQLELELIKHVRDLAELRDQQLRELETKYKTYKSAFGQTLKPIELPDAPDTSASLKDIENYLLAVKAAGGQIEDYLKTNTVSFFATKVLTGFTKGITEAATEALTNAGELKKEVAVSDLAAKAKELKNILLAEVKEDVSSAKDTAVKTLKDGAKEAMASVTSTFTKLAKEKATGFARNLANKAACGFEDAVKGTQFDSLAKTVGANCSR